MRYWWVSHNQTYREEVGGGYLWSPKTKKPKEGQRAGEKNYFYCTMKLVRSGDIVFSFYKSQIQAVGIAKGTASNSRKPKFSRPMNEWTNTGWKVPVDFILVDKPFRPKDKIERIRPLLNASHAPLKADGKGNQMYLTDISDELATTLFKLLGQSQAEFETAVDVAEFEQEADQAEKGIQGRTDIPSTKKATLIDARKGQGIFKTNVRKNESRCRVTGTSDSRLLTASHIKPWSKSNDIEKLHGCNGLLLAPHVDRLFDRGLISFEDNGDLIVSEALNRNELIRWGIEPIQNVGGFKQGQKKFLRYHRRHILKRSQ